MTNTKKNTAESGAETRKYLVIDASSKFDPSNAWYYHCQAKHIPFVEILCRKKYATVTWDCRVLQFSYDELVEKKEAELFAGFEKLLHKHGNKKSWLMGRTLPQFQNIAIDQAYDLAEELYDFVAETLGMGLGRGLQGQFRYAAESSPVPLLMA